MAKMLNVLQCSVHSQHLDGNLCMNMCVLRSYLVEGFSFVWVCFVYFVYFDVVCECQWIFTLLSYT